MEITAEQRAFLESFTCQRLNADTHNRDLLDAFTSKHGQQLVDTIKNHGRVRDYKGTVAYYVVKNAAGEIVMFFSLRCGLICEPGYLRRVAGLLNESRTLREALRGAEAGDRYWTDYLKAQEQALGREELDRRITQLAHHLEKKAGILSDAEQDKALLPDQDVVRVDEIHAAVELVEFCVNDAARGCWDRARMGGNRMGTTLFWQFVVPKMLAVSEIAGCEYAYLFAAGKRGSKLVELYRRDLHFIEPRNLSAVKPSYDRDCVLMIKKLFTNKAGSPGDMGLLEPDPDFLGLDRHQAEFFRKFNKNAHS